MRCPKSLLSGCLGWKWAWAWLPTRKLSSFCCGDSKSVHIACKQNRTDGSYPARFEDKCPQVVMHRVSSKLSFSLKSSNAMLEKHLIPPLLSHWIFYLLICQRNVIFNTGAWFLSVKYPWGLLRSQKAVGLLCISCGTRSFPPLASQ